MLNFVKKDLLLFWRNRWEMAIILLLPIVLIVILNFAFSNIFDDTKSLDLTLAVVNEDHEEDGIRRFQEQVMAMDVDEETAGAYMTQAAQLAPVSYINGYLNSPELAEWLEVQEVSESEALRQLEEGEIDGWLKIPQDYTYNMLNAIVIGENSAVELPFIVRENSMNVSMLESVIGEFFDQVNFQLALQQATGDASANESAPEGGREMVAGAASFTMTQYFTIAIGTLFALFLASTVAEKTGAEIREQVFNRIAVTNTRPIAFLMGKTFATFCLVWLQFMFVLTVSHFLMGVLSGKSLEDLAGFVLMITVFAMAMAGLSALYTSIMLKVSNIDAANGLFMMVTMVFGIIGGGFVPIYLLPLWLQRIGEWVPNGLTLAALTEWIQFGKLEALWMPVLALSGFAFACLLAGIALFPKRGEV